MSKKKMFVLGMGTAFGAMLGFAIYNERKKNELEKSLSNEILAMLIAKNEGRATDEQLQEYADYIAYELVIHGYKSLREYEEIDVEVDKLLLHYHGHPTQLPAEPDNAVDAEVAEDENNNVITQNTAN